jgi:hypothetical protein
MNQTKHCWQNYVDYHKCIIAKGEDFAPCRQVGSPLLDLDGDDMHTDLRDSFGLPTVLSVPLVGTSAGTSSEVIATSDSYGNLES